MRPMKQIAATAQQTGREIQEAANKIDDAAGWVSYFLSRLAGDGIDLSLVKSEKDGKYKLRWELPEPPAPDPNPLNEVSG